MLTLNQKHWLNAWGDRKSTDALWDGAYWYVFIDKQKVFIPDVPFESPLKNHWVFSMFDHEN